MHLSYLKLRQFRSYTQLNLQLHPRLNVLVGDNAQGKTNIVEAIYFLSENHSFRTSTIGDLIQWGAPAAVAETELVREDLRDHVLAEVGPSGKHFFRNGKKCRGVQELTTVLFAPEALRLTKDGPSERREFLDHLLGQLYPVYRPTLRKYQQVLIQHNRLLQNEDAFGETLYRQLDGWKTQLIEYGAELTVLRASGVQAINQYLPEAYAAIAGEGASLLLRYAPRNGADEAGQGKDAVMGVLAAAFRERAEDESRRRVTLVGPHRDDFSAFIGGREVRFFASQGEHRSCVLALKRCEILLLREAYGHSPILLLDDVASELDPDRNRSFFSHLLETDGQVIVSAVSRETVSLPESENSRWFSVGSGNVKTL